MRTTGFADCELPTAAAALIDNSTKIPMLCCLSGGISIYSATRSQGVVHRGCSNRGNDAHMPRPNHGSAVNRKDWQGSGAGFRGLLFAQVSGTLVTAVIVVVITGRAMPALWGGSICLLGYAWGAWQLRPRPGPAEAQRVLARVVWAQLGKVTIFLMLFALSFRFGPSTHQPQTLGGMLAGFAGAQVAGWLYFARRGGIEGTGDNAGNQDGE